MNYSNYTGKSCGKVLHFIDHYCTLCVAEQAIFGEGKIKYWGKLLATTTWTIKEINGIKIDVPIFAFDENTDSGKAYQREQKYKQEITIMKLKEYHDGRGDMLAYEDYWFAYDKMVTNYNKGK